MMQYDSNSNRPDKSTRSSSSSSSTKKTNNRSSSSSGRAMKLQKVLRHEAASMGKSKTTWASGELQQRGLQQS